MNTNNKNKIKTRLFVNTNFLEENSFITIDGSAFHHLNVLRIKLLDYISVFNAYGEFLAQITSINKKEATIKVLHLIKSAKSKKFNLHLAYAPLKKDANDYALEKATEVGVNEITQIITKNTVNKPIDVDKITQKVILATQQCERLDIPQVNLSINLEKFLETHKNKLIFWLYERGSDSTLSQYLLENKTQEFKDVIFLIGPEGGFAESEINLLNSLNFVKQVHLNTNILRAETACVASLINFQVISCNF
ncbi:MAG: 16S rRNA (uracil(1498)-N(3))-methyltransferase [Alphaproteobacteria bacterium]|jgi:16S rRNA (uracil1498-N3)-methyltransferase|nr:16S rRNA (uracil(1498)-N(3))-methyltransferase [Alphaproteobacteria bacterium]